jgi:hypothetical protein
MHIHMIEDERGDLVDIDYYCSQYCADAANIPQPSLTFGEETDYCIICANCGDHIQRGIEYDALCPMCHTMVRWERAARAMFNAATKDKPITLSPSLYDKLKPEQRSKYRRG